MRWTASALGGSTVRRNARSSPTCFECSSMEFMRFSSTCHRVTRRANQRPSGSKGDRALTDTMSISCLHCCERRASFSSESAKERLSDCSMPFLSSNSAFKAARLRAAPLRHTSHEKALRCMTRCRALTCCRPSRCPRQSSGCVSKRFLDPSAALDSRALGSLLMQPPVCD
jgi:hypothetical protein